MIRPARFRALCSSLGDVEERPHFDRTAFRTPARTFATLGPTGEDVNVLLPLEVQQMLVDAQPSAFMRLNGAWGARGWTRMQLARVDEVTCREVLREAYLLAAPTRGTKSKTVKSHRERKAQPESKAKAKASTAKRKTSSARSPKRTSGGGAAKRRSR